MGYFQYAQPKLTQYVCRRELGESRWNRGHFPEAIKLFHEFSTSNELADFLTIAAYDAVVEKDSVKPSKL